jgi:hypothetical protein
MSNPSVTQVLSPWSDFSKIPEDVLEYAAWRGTEVHRLCSIYARGLPIIGEIRPSCAGFFLSFQQWVDTCVEKVHLVEAELAHPAYGYIGHPDLIVTIKGDPGPTLVDLKTPVIESPTWKGQLSAYDELAQVNGHEIYRVGVLMLKRDGGTAKFKEYKRDGRDLAAFLSALTAYRFFGGGENGKRS